MNAVADIRALNQRVGMPGRIAGILAVLAVIVLLVSLRGLGNAFFAPSAKNAKQMELARQQQLSSEYVASLENQVKQFNGRSVFFIPGKPIPPPPPPPPKTDEETKPPPPPPPPATYGGPKLIGMVNGVAWFDDGKRLSAGSDAKDKLRVKEVKAPWDAVVEWEGVEFTISLFDKDKVVYPPPKKEEPKKEEPAKAAAAEPAQEPAKEPAKETGAGGIKTGEPPAASPEEVKKEKPESPAGAGNKDGKQE